jgi:thiol-disulfide isomerase/thioredoxin
MKKRFAAGIAFAAAYSCLSAMADGVPPVTGQVSTAGQTELASTTSDDIFTDGAGQVLRLADFHGKIVLLNFWAGWCAPCKAEIASLDRLQATLGGTDFVVVPVSVDGSKSAIESTYAEHGVSHLGIYRELSDEFPLRMGVRGLPTNIVIGRDGRVIHFSVGPTQWDSSEALQLVKSFIGGIPAPSPAGKQANIVTAAMPHLGPGSSSR